MSQYDPGDKLNLWSAGFGAENTFVTEQTGQIRKEPLWDSGTPEYRNEPLWLSDEDLGIDSAAAPRSEWLWDSEGAPSTPSTSSSSSSSSSTQATTPAPAPTPPSTRPYIWKYQ